MGDKVKIINRTCGAFAYGRDFIIRPSGESIVDRATWERFKLLPHIAPKIAAGSLVAVDLEPDVAPLVLVAPQGDPQENAQDAPGDDLDAGQGNVQETAPDAPGDGLDPAPGDKKPRRKKSKGRRK